MHAKKKDKLYNWIPKRSLGPISFFDGEEKVLSFFDKPSESYKDVYPGLEVHEHLYLDKGLSFSFEYFDDEEGKEESLSISTEYVFLNGKDLYQMTFRQLKKYLEKLGLHPQNEKKYEREVLATEETGIEIQYTFPQLGATFWYKGKREGIQMTDVSLRGA